MNSIKLSLEQIQEISRIYAMLQSNDEESRALGFEIFRQSLLYRDHLCDASYITESHKQIPISWYIKKCLEDKKEGSSFWTRPIVPIIECIIKGQHRFIAKFYFTDIISAKVVEEQSEKLLKKADDIPLPF